jgi:hypothetical protein
MPVVLFSTETKHRKLCANTIRWSEAAGFTSCRRSLDRQLLGALMCLDFLTNVSTDLLTLLDEARNVIQVLASHHSCALLKMHHIAGHLLSDGHVSDGTGGETVCALGLGEFAKYTLHPNVVILFSKNLASQTVVQNPQQTRS